MSILSILAKAKRYVPRLQDPAEAALRALRALGPDEAARVVSQAPRSLPAGSVLARGERGRLLSREATEPFRLAREAASTARGRARLTRATGQAVPEGLIPAGQRRGIVERAYGDILARGGTLRALPEGNLARRAVTSAIARPGRAALIGVPAGLAALAMGPSLGRFAGSLVGIGGPDTSGGGLTPEQQAAIIAQIGTGATQEDILRRGLEEDIAATRESYTVDPALERELRLRSQILQDAEREAYQKAAEEYAAQAAGTSPQQAAAGRVAGAGSRAAADIAAGLGTPAGTAVSPLTPLSGEAAGVAAETEAAAKRAASQLVASGQMRDEDLAYLSGVLQIQGTENANAMSRAIDQALLERRLVGSQQAAEAEALLRQRYRDTLADLSLERAKQRGEVVVPRGDELTDLVNQFANEWNSLSTQDKEIVGRQYGVSDAQGYVVAKLRERGLVG